VLGADKGHRDRSRFDAVHELAHLVLHRHLEPGDVALERQAHAFSAAFLMPASDIAHRLPAKVDSGVLIYLKREWQVSIAALLMRAKTVGSMSDAEYTKAMKAMKAMSARGWRRQEPADLGAPELNGGSLGLGGGGSQRRPRNLPKQGQGRDKRLLVGDPNGTVRRGASIWLII
jgi:Zn-dependent peptidase ImmA (M78 family)